LKPGGGCVSLHKLWQCWLVGDWRIRRAGVFFRAIGMFSQIGISGLAVKPYSFWQIFFVLFMIVFVGRVVRIYSRLSFSFCLCISSRFFLLSSFLLEGLVCFFRDVVSFSRFDVSSSVVFFCFDCIDVLWFFQSEYFFVVLYSEFP
jgi:hypothetical protein